MKASRACKETTNELQARTVRPCWRLWALTASRCVRALRSPAHEEAGSPSAGLLGRRAGAAGRCPARQAIPVVGRPGVDARGQPGDPRSHQQRAHEAPDRSPCAQGRRDGGVSAGHLSILANPLGSRSALLCSEPQLSQVQPLPWRNRGCPAFEHPMCQEMGAARAESAVSVEDQNRLQDSRAHEKARCLTRAARLVRGAGERPRAAWAEPWSGQ
jgi:hypothetical protein